MKKIFMLSIFIIVISIMVFGLPVLASPAENLSAGTAKVKITPEKPIPMAGYRSRSEPFEGVHDDLFTRAVVFNDGSKKAALISADVIWFPEESWERITDGILKETGIQREYVMFSATHTHGGPITLISEDSPYKKDVDQYVNVLEEKIISVVKKADSRLKPAAIGAGKGECLMNINRRAVNAEGDIVLGRNPYGVCDHSVGVVRIDYENRSPMAIILNWSSHATTMGSRNYLITGDWPGAAARYVESQFKDAIVTPVTVGSSGNINPIYGPVGDFSMAYSYGVDAIGLLLGSEAVKVAGGVKTSPGSISAAQKVLMLPGKENIEKDGKLVFEPGPEVMVRLSALKIGDVIFAGIAQEFTEIGLQIKEQSPYKNTFIIDHCNASYNYIPTDKAYDEGGYEVKTSRLQKGSEKLIVKSVLELINGL